ncbi:PTS sugar transporter subunit IIA [Caldisericum exile]|uniref:Ascorbate-specific PTS system EIIA component n=1 Tax=Caldisericum exile (strain DSM 21853 / NBRC 104410 / AZM16c01) TaxID=511051 RepID=A0A7U6GFR3_CALEA|nr:PTS sugar transporter subunit IIA [Caldisericum exile]BAL81579.1 putative phosphotransferase system enzyme IIA component [Caldisericum exile AZM16c01]
MEMEETLGNIGRNNLPGLISEECVLLDIEARDAEEALNLGCEILVKTGAVTKEYCELIINSFHKNGPYFVIAPHFALSHARNEGNCVKKVAISFLRLSKPVYFGHPDNDPVDLIITLATPDDKSHIGTMAELSEILMDEESWDILEKGTLKEVLNLLTKRK